MIVSIIAAHMNKAEAERTLVKPPATWQAYDYFLRAANVYASYLSSWKAEELYKARQLFERSISFDPNFARAYAELSRTCGTAWLNAVDKDFRSAAILERAVQLAHEALRLDPNLLQSHAQMGIDTPSGIGDLSSCDQACFWPLARASTLQYFLTIYCPEAVSAAPRSCAGS